MENSPNYSNLRGQNCNLTRIVGVESLLTKSGIDLIKGIDGLDKVSQYIDTIEALTRRIDHLEMLVKTLQNQTPVAPVVQQAPVVQSAPVNTQAIVKQVLDNIDLESLRGPRGFKGSSQLNDLTDVNVDNLEDGAMLVWKFDKKNPEKGKWEAKLIEFE